MATYDSWKTGYGKIKHTTLTQARIEALVARLKEEGVTGDGVEPYALLEAADRLANAAMWLVVHLSYAKQVYPDGRMLEADDFKKDPQGHIGGALNMVPAYIGYLLANALTGQTRSWVMEQGHAVAAIDTVNMLVNNMTPEHASRYRADQKGMTRFVQDFYSYALNAEGKPDSPLGSHVNPHTAGGYMEGGYLGFASVQYAHMPLPGEQLVAFLSDGAFEEQRGADWMPRWWRMQDSGLVMPIMIANGRRIDQRTFLAQEGGVKWFKKFLRLHHFDPIVCDGRDPAAFAWMIIEQEKRLKRYALVPQAEGQYHVPIPYGIAVAPKGAGFYNAGTNAAHNLPLKDNPAFHAEAAHRFNHYAQKLYVAPDVLQSACALFQQHQVSGRTKERDHPLAHRKITYHPPVDILLAPFISPPLAPKEWTMVSPMDAVDEGFLAAVHANMNLRPRIGNPDEIRSNRMLHTLNELSFRVSDTEKGSSESPLGQIITALNEEAVAGAAFGNKGGINMIVTYEAFAAKMFGEARQEVTFSRHQKELGRPAGWLSVPIILTSHSWENSKNELSHQDPSFAESMLSESSDISRVLFPADINSTAVAIHQVYQTTGQIWSMVVPKQKVPVLLQPIEARQLWMEGALILDWAGYKPQDATLMVVAIGSYQLAEVLKACVRLRQGQVPVTVLYMMEPGRFRIPRHEGEKLHAVLPEIQERLVPSTIRQMLLVTHTRPEIMVGTLQPLWQGRSLVARGFINQGGTLGVDDMLYVNRCSWAHILADVTQMLQLERGVLLTEEEWEALEGKRSPDGVVTKIG